MVNETRSEQTIAGLARAKSRGVQLGHPSTVPNSTKLLIANLRAEGLAWRLVVDHLNANAVPTPSGIGRWHPTSAKRHNGIPDA